MSNAVTPIAPATAQATPATPTPTAGNASALVRFTAPANGGSAITGYSVRVVNATTGALIGALRPAAAGATSLTVTGLVSGTAYRFRVGASNALGLGAGSALSNTVTAR
jgi:titin